MIQKHGHAFRETDRCCHNCKHLLWMIGVGFGLRCGFQAKEELPPTVPSIGHVCENFSGRLEPSTEWSCKCEKCNERNIRRNTEIH